jgi:hypothetical protein
VTRIYVHTPERFEFRQVASASLDRIVCDNQRGSAKDDRDRDDDD